MTKKKEIYFLWKDDMQIVLLTEKEKQLIKEIKVWGKNLSNGEINSKYSIEYLNNNKKYKEIIIENLKKKNIIIDENDQENFKIIINLSEWEKEFKEVINKNKMLINKEKEDIIGMKLNNNEVKEMKWIAKQIKNNDD